MSVQTFFRMAVMVHTAVKDTLVPSVCHGYTVTAFNGQTITYDEIGNPLQYLDRMTLPTGKA